MAGAGPPDSNDPGDAADPGASAQDEAQRAARVAAARERFVTLARRPERDVPLAEAALLIAAEEFPAVDASRYLGMLDALGHRVRRRLAAAREIGGRDADEAAFEALHGVLFEEEGFSGPPPGSSYEHEDYFLSGGLDRRRGLPIVLSVIYCEVAARAGLTAVGINLPAHFMAQFRGEHSSVLVDPFNRGARVAPDAEPMGVPQSRLPIASRKQILARMLQNLKFLYVQSRPPHLIKALAAVERILVIAPSMDQVRDRGIILRGLGMQAVERARLLRRSDRAAAAYAVDRAGQFLGPAWFDLKLYTRLSEGAPDAAQIGELADQLWLQLGRQN
jgi:regulator of sirC expression with transglutaminase-like and TPR domain